MGLESFGRISLFPGFAPGSFKGFSDSRTLIFFLFRMEVLHLVVQDVGCVGFLRMSDVLVFFGSDLGFGFSGMFGSFGFSVIWIFWFFKGCSDVDLSVVWILLVLQDDRVFRWFSVDRIFQDFQWFGSCWFLSDSDFVGFQWIGSCCCRLLIQRWKRSVRE